MSVPVTVGDIGQPPLKEEHSELTGIVQRSNVVGHQVAGRVRTLGKRLGYLMEGSDCGGIRLATLDGSGSLLCKDWSAVLEFFGRGVEERRSPADRQRERQPR